MNGQVDRLADKQNKGGYSAAQMSCKEMNGQADRREYGQADRGTGGQADRENKPKRATVACVGK